MSLAAAHTALTSRWADRPTSDHASGTGNAKTSSSEAREKTGLTGATVPNKIGHPLGVRTRRRASGTVRIGTSGWTYANWRDVFYPPGLPQRRQLEHLAACFPTVEV